MTESARRKRSATEAAQVGSPWRARNVPDAERVLCGFLPGASADAARDGLGDHGRAAVATSVPCVTIETRATVSASFSESFQSTRQPTGAMRMPAPFVSESLVYFV